MWIEKIEKGFCDLGQFVIKLQPDAPRKEGERFDYALDVRVFDLFLIQMQPGGDLRIL